jgi:hypothetical protein
MSSAGNTTDVVFDVSGYFTTDTTGATYHPMTPPARLLDTRTGNGLSGKFLAKAPRTFQVSGRGAVLAGATAVTGNLTVVNSTNSGAVYIGPDPVFAPSTSTVNFNKGQVIANNLTVALSSDGKLSATLLSAAGARADLVFDVTGYYTADATGLRFVPVTPARFLDTRSGNGLVGKLKANVARTFQIGARISVPSGARAITGNLAIVGESSSGAIFVGPTASARPSTSTLNFRRGDIRANGLTVALSPTGGLSATFLSRSGYTTDLVLDVTGYFVP